MTHFTSGFWDVFIAVVTIVSIVACAVFLKSQSKRKLQGDAPTTGHVWDEDLAEYNNPLPRWWSWLFYITIVFSLVYLVLYPGLGSWRGTLGWTQVGQYEAEQARALAKYGPLYERFAATDVVELAKDSEALAIGQRIFLNTCAQCHASDAGGSRGFPSLTAGLWRWGGEPKTIHTTIAEGRTGVMPPFGAALGDQGVKDVVHYLMSLTGRPHDSIRRARGEPLFKSTCAACHGPEAKGNPALGAPDLTGRGLMYGTSEAALIESVTRGRTSVMPAHKDILDEARIHLVTAYILSLSQKGR